MLTAAKTHEQVTVEMDGGDWEENGAAGQRKRAAKTAGGGNYMASLADENTEGSETDA